MVTPFRIGGEAIARRGRFRASVASGQVTFLEDLDAEPDATLADEEPRPGDQSRKVGTPRRLWRNRPAQLIAEGASRRIRKLATLGHGEEDRQVHTPSVPQPRSAMPRAESLESADSGRRAVGLREGDRMPEESCPQCGQDLEVVWGVTIGDSGDYQPVFKCATTRTTSKNCRNTGRRKSVG